MMIFDLGVNLKTPRMAAGGPDDLQASLIVGGAVRLTAPAVFRRKGCGDAHEPAAKTARHGVPGQSVDKLIIA